MSSKVYPLKYYSIQDVFAHRVSELCNVPLEQSYKENTRFFNLIEKTHPEDFEEVRKIFMSKILSISDDQERYEYIYKELNKNLGNMPKKEHIGCFSYNFSEKFNAVSLHFSNIETNGESPLSSKNIEKRKSEIKEVLRRIKKEPYGKTANFRFYSWLGSFEPFRRLFPSELFKDAPVKDYYSSEANWGQFLDRNTNIREDMFNSMLACITKATNKKELYECFPYKAIEAIAPLNLLYKYFDV